MAKLTTMEQAPPSPKSARFTPWSLIIWGVTAVIIFILGFGLLTLNESRPEVGANAPDFAMTFFDGYEWQKLESATLSQMEGQVVVINFWASWCIECRLEADILQKASQRYADDVIFLGIAWTDTEPKSLRYLEEFGITYPNAPDLGLNAGADYEITGVPETFFIDKSGQIAHVIIGPVSEDVLDGVIPPLVNQ